ncbi:N-acetylmuramoyl-L-alanine amidase-like domain-containing protein [Larkinella soli]|uniref:N-acetylmuramoyl-L-alanine amidase-like domain-containing protein n=1 Tax=Larkinella soli TaxID=1770527 RepID=UPI000FFBD73A|nr:N-acetylmuramoyl-L-alanine amidase-like domain-containing protein [Larkinella soli]
MKSVLTILVTVAFCTFSFAQSPLPESDIRQISVSAGPSTAETAVSIGKSFLGRPYVAHTLDGNETERLVVNFRTFDCTTFLETVLALSIAWNELPDPTDTGRFGELFQQNLTRIRYRDGRVNGYASRLHYFSEWLLDNERKGILQDVTREIGGIQVSKPVSYMTACTWKYPPLTDPAVFQEMARVESDLSRQPFWFIPKKKIGEVEGNLQEGDIIMLTASRPGLDMKHVGLVTWQTGSDGIRRAHLLHASSEYGQVVISEEPLSTYVAWNRQFSGIRVARLKPPGRPVVMQARN